MLVSLSFVDGVVMCCSLVKMVFGFASQSRSTPTWCELQHAILRNFGGLDDVEPVKVFAKHLRQIDKDAEVCALYTYIPVLTLLTLTVAIWVQLAIKHPVLDWVKPSFVNFDIWAL